MRENTEHKEKKSRTSGIRIARQIEYEHIIREGLTEEQRQKMREHPYAFARKDKKHDS